MSLIEEPKLLLYQIFSMILFLFAIMIVYGYFVNPTINVNFYTEDLQFDIVASRILNTPECLAWEDSESRVHPGTIDVSKYDQVGEPERPGLSEEDRIGNCLGLEKSKYMIKLWVDKGTGEVHDWQYKPRANQILRDESQTYYVDPPSKVYLVDVHYRDHPEWTNGMIYIGLDVAPCEWESHDQDDGKDSNERRGEGLIWPEPWNGCD